MNNRDLTKCHYSNETFDIGAELHNDDIEASCTIGNGVFSFGDNEWNLTLILKVVVAVVLGQKKTHRQALSVPTLIALNFSVAPMMKLQEKNASDSRTLIKR